MRRIWEEEGRGIIPGTLNYYKQLLFTGCLVISNPFLCTVKLWFNIQLKTTIQNSWFFLGTRQLHVFPVSDPFDLTWSRVKVLQLQVEIPRSCWSSGRSGKAEFCRLWMGVCLFQLDFFFDFFFGGGSEKNTHQILRVQMMTMIIWIIWYDDMVVFYLGVDTYGLWL